MSGVDLGAELVSLGLILWALGWYLAYRGALRRAGGPGMELWARASLVGMGSSSWRDILDDDRRVALTLLKHSSVRRLELIRLMTLVSIGAVVSFGPASSSVMAWLTGKGVAWLREPSVAFLELVAIWWLAECVVALWRRAPLRGVGAVGVAVVAILLAQRIAVWT